MRIKIALASEAGSGPVLVPIHYNHLVQGFVYNNLDAALARWLHDEGHAYEKRRFKLFTFSRLFGKRERKGDRLRFDRRCSFHLASAEVNILSSLAEHLLRKPQVRLGSARLRVEEVAVEPEPRVDGSPIVVRTMSPITTYSTLVTAEGRKKTYFYSPQEEEWSEHLIENIKRKAKALGWEADADEDLEDAYVRPKRVRTADQKVLSLKGTVVKGWTGLYEIKMPEPYFRLAHDAGLGSKNAQGFGMVEVLNGRGGEGA